MDDEVVRGTPGGSASQRLVGETSQNLMQKCTHAVQPTIAPTRLAPLDRSLYSKVRQGRASWHSRAVHPHLKKQREIQAPLVNTDTCVTRAQEHMVASIWPVASERNTKMAVSR